MTFTINERDLYFGISVILLCIQVYQGIVNHRLKNFVDTVASTLSAYMLTSGHVIDTLEKKIEDLERKNEK